MKITQRTKQILSIFLVLFLVLSMAPINALAAEEDDTEWLQQQIDLAVSETGSGVITLDRDIMLTKPVVFPAGKTVSLQGTAEKYPTIKPAPGFKGSALLVISAGIQPETGNPIETQVTLDRLIIHGAMTCRGIWVESNARLKMGGFAKDGNRDQERVTIQYCYSAGANDHGSGIRVKGGTVYAYHVEFANNIAQAGSGTSGGAIAFANGQGMFRDCVFNNNSAHSGGALYFYGASDTSVLFVRNCTFDHNIADQRGGALLCHGYALINETTFTNNESDQYGGAIYISSQDKLVPNATQGKLTLRDSVVTQNTAGNSGAGVFISNHGYLYLAGKKTTVADNFVNESTGKQRNNVFYSGVNSRIIVTSETDAVGVSTSNPVSRKLAVFSAAESDDPTDFLQEEIVTRLAFQGWIGPAGFDDEWRDGMGYSMANNPEAYLNFSYDGEAWRLAIFPDNSITDKAIRDKFDKGTLAAITGAGEGHVKGNMWLVLDATGGGSSGTTSEKYHVVFDYNLPGETAIVKEYAKGTVITEANGWPTSPKEGDVIRDGRVKFTHLGWYTDPKEGTPVNPGVTVDKDAVYFAHWKTEVIDGGGGIPTFKGIYLVYFDQNYPGGGFTASYKVAGQFHFTAEYQFTNPDTGEKETGYEDVNVNIPWGWPSPPSRNGYNFLGWSLSSNGPVVNEATWKPTVRDGATTLYGQWKAKSYTLVWDINDGDDGGGETSQGYDTTVIPPNNVPTRSGYEFTGWYLDKNCTIPLTSGTLVTGSATFYAGWTPKEYTITWDAGYTGGGITTIQQHHDDKLNIPPAPTREGYTFGGWYKGNTRAEGYGTVREDATFTARWTNIAQTYTVTAEWDDHSNNDLVRPESIKVSLLANGIPTGLSYTLDASNADSTGNKWSYTFAGLDVTDAVSNPITYSVAITSTVSDQYSYGIENKSAELGYILLTHSLITTDINSYVVWEDDSNNDGYRPATVNLQLCANGEKVNDAEARLSISGSGDTWRYTFKDFQKYYTDDAGNKGREIRYTLEAMPTNPGELSKYKIAYHNYTVILSHQKDTVSRTTHVEWQDNNDQDGKRPASMAVQLYADNVPLEGKVVLLSDANNWTYTWDELPKFADGGRQVTYSARVTSTLVDYTAKSAGMTIEMTYVPSSTSISAFVTWTDENDADGLRPDYITAELVADGKPTGDRQVLSATNGWTMTWSNYPIYKDGKRIEYTFKVDAPEGYEAAYHGVYDTSGLSAVLTHERLKQSLTGNIVWEDRNNQSGGRMSRVAVQLYADGAVIDEDEKVWISADEGWEHTFSDLPIYRDGGEEIKYSMVLVSDPGKYVPTTSKMTITMRLEPEYVDVPFQIIWDDNNNSDGQRPGYVAVTLLVDGKPSQYGQTATAQTDWAADFTHLDRYGANGLYSYKAQLVIVPEGYTATYTSADVVVLKRVAETKNVTATVIWQDNDDQYGQRPEQVTLTLYADQLDGNGPQNTGRVEKCKAADGWEFTFEDVPAYHGGKNIIYSVVASGNLPNYTISYDGMDVYMRHAAYVPDVYTSYTANLVWHDGHNAKGSRPYNILVTLYANGESFQTYTMTEADLDNTGYTWSYTFKKLPTKIDGADVVYTIGITEPSHYTAQTEDNTITLTHVMDIPVLLRWADQRNNDGVRPSALTLNLYGDAAQTDTTLTLTGGSTAETWRDSFQQIPVWSEGLLDHEIVYTWAFAGDNLTDKGYSVDYNGYSTATVGNEALYPIDITRPGEVTDIAATILWNDNMDQDGLRPTSRTVRLYADGEDTGKAITLEGGNEDENWRDKFTALPVWKAGQRIQYSIEAEALEDYVATSVPGDPLTLMMSHTPFMDDISATVVWRDDTNQGGLTRFPISVAMKVDGTVTDNIQTIEHPNTSVSFGEHPRYHNHGKPYEYAVQVTDTTMADKPADYDITAKDFTITVKRARFLLKGKVLDYAGAEIPTATVTLYSTTGGVMLGQTISGVEGEFSFTVTPGNYSLLASLYSDGINSGSAMATISTADVQQDIRLARSMVRYTISGQVKDSNRNPAAYAQIVVVRVGYGVVATITADEQGNYSLNNIPKGIYELQATYTYNGRDYLSETIYCSLSADAVRNITVVVPGPDVLTNNISGKIVHTAGGSVDRILVRCRNKEAYPKTLLVETTTDASGAYSFQDLPADNYYLTFINQNGQELQVKEKVEFTVPKVSMDIELPTVEITGDTVMGSEQSGTGVLSGVVLDKDGQPLQGAQIIVVDNSTGDRSGVCVTNPNGAFQATLPTGEYSVEVWHPFENTTDLPIHANDEEADREDGLVTADSFTISGEVLDENGEPKEGVTVYLYVEDDQAIEVVLLQLDEDEVEPDTEPELDVLALGGYVRLDEVVTAEDGKYVFTNLPAGRYVVKIAEGIGGNGGSTDIPVTVAPFPEIPDDADLTITTDSYTVTGVVEGRDGQPVNGATVTLQDEQGKEVDRLTTSEDGVYEFANLPKGDYTVNISYPDSELLDKGDVTLPDGGFTVFPGCAVTDTIKDNKGNALANVTVTFQDDANNLYTAVTDKDGTYRVALADGKYTMVASYQGKTAEKTITVKGQATKADLTITMTTGDNTNPGGNTTSGDNTNPGGNTTPSGSGSTGISGGFDPGPVEEQPTSYVLSGVVLDKDKKPVEGATVTAVNTKTGETHTATTGPDGKYALAVPKGSYSITITYGSTTTNPKKVSVSKDTALDKLTLDNAGRLVRAYVNGYADGTFGGDNHISRSEVAALISRVSADFDKDKTYSFEFEDVAEGVWYANNLGYCVEAGLIQGRGNGHFDPTASITRSEFAAIVARFLGLPNEVTGENPYTDTAGNWAEGYIARLTAKGIVEGKGDGKFDPTANITRYEAVTMLNRALERAPDTAVLDALAANRTIRVFPDLAVTHWAYYQVLEAANDHYHK